MAVSDIGNMLSQQFLLRTLRIEMDEQQRRVATGKKTDTFSGLTPTESVNSMTFRQNRLEMEGYISNINIALTRTRVMDEAMVDITDYARDIATQLRTQMQDTEPNTQILVDSARTAFEQVKQRLNTKLGDRYLFAGTDIRNAPHDPAIGNLDANFIGLMGGWIGGGATAAQVAADSRTFSDGQLDFSPTSLAASRVSIPTDEDVSVDYTVMANDAGFQDILRGLAVVANLQHPTTAAEQDDFWEVVNGALQLLDDGAKAVDQQIAILGNKSRIMEDTKTEHIDLQATLEIFIGEEEDVDIAESISKFQQIQVQLEASYRVTASVREFTLVNFI